MAFLNNLASLRNPVLNWIMQIITYCGEELLFMAVALVLFWCVDKWKGYYILAVGFLGTIATQWMKLIYRVPRPWVEDPNFEIVPSAKSGATGYSFPSGHSQSAACTFGGIARFTKKNWLRIVCIVLMFLVGFSRMFLGAHYPSDVAVGLAIGILLVVVMYPIVKRAKENPRWMYGLLGCLVLVNIVYLVYLNVYDFPAEVFLPENAENYTEGLANGWKLLGALLGLILAYTVDLKKLHFSEKAPLPGQICKVVVGLLLVVGIQKGLKPVFALISDDAFWHALRYFCVVVFAGAVWPLSFPFWKRIGAK